MSHKKATLRSDVGHALACRGREPPPPPRKWVQCKFHYFRSSESSLWTPEVYPQFWSRRGIRLSPASQKQIWWTAVRFETRCRLDTPCPLKVAGRTNSYRCTMTPEVEADSHGRPGILFDLAGCFETAGGNAE